jgi:hypothetical protein
MLKWITCYLSGNHDYHVACEPGAIFLQCHHCGRRSDGWELQRERSLQDARMPMPEPARARAPMHNTR